MKLSIKLFKIVFSVSFILILFLYIFSKSFLLKSFTEIEIDKANTDTQIVLNYIQRELSNLNTINVDYAMWNDTYNYVNNRNNNYIPDNFSDITSLKRSNIGFVIITDALGGTIYKINVADKTKDIFNEAFTNNITSDIFKQLNDNKSNDVIGVMIEDKIPILISAERITKNDGSGDKSGIFVIAKYFDKNEIYTINQNTELKTELLTYNSKIISNNNSQKKNIFIKVINSNLISGFGVLSNINGKPSLLVKVTLPRDVFKKADNVINLYIIILIVILLLFCISIFTFIHIFVVKRINSIKSIVEKIYSSKDLSTIINLQGNDEISELGFNFNNMFYRLKKSDERIAELAYSDALTGLPNRKKMLENVSIIIENKNEKFAVLFIDLDNFKSINDNFGHEVGDNVLAKVADRIKNNISKNHIISRIGGDEFIIILKDISSYKKADEIAATIVKMVSDVFICNDMQLFIGASVGISVFPEHGTDVDTLIKNADSAMYEVKNNGGYGYALYSTKMKDKAIDKLKMKKELKNALENHEFKTYYQPIINLISMKVLSAESLIRWEQNGKVILPMEFIPIAKSIGEIVAIDNWMLENACLQCKKWHEQGVKDFRVSVNTSYKQLKQLDFTELVINILHTHSLSPMHLNLEITEDEVMEDPELIISRLNQLKALGVKISLDDFGTGYSSLSYVNKLPIDIIKIDKSLIDNLQNDSKNVIIIKSIILMAHSLNIKVVAEGIETENQFNILRELECDSIQGYLIGKPMIASDFEEKFIK